MGHRSASGEGEAAPLLPCSRSWSDTALRMDEKIPRPLWKLGLVVMEPASLGPRLQTSLSASESREARRPISSDFFCWISSRSMSEVEPHSEGSLSEAWLAVLLRPSLPSSQLPCSSPGPGTCGERGTN